MRLFVTNLQIFGGDIRLSVVANLGLATDRTESARHALISSYAYTTLFTLNPNCFHLDSAVPTPPTDHENVR